MKGTTIPLFLTLTASFFGGPALASPELEEGMAMYKSHQLVKAKPLLEKAAKESPQSWQAHYYLANTYLGLGQMSLAKYEYENCKRLSPPATIIGHCNVGIKRVEAHVERVKAQSAPVEDRGAEEGTEDGREEKKPLTDAEIVIERRKTDIMQEAREAADRIRKEAQDQVDAEKSQANQRWRDEEGRRYYSISQEREAEILREAEIRAARIMEEARKRADAVR